MTEGMIIDVGAGAMRLVIFVAGPMLGLGLIVGVLVAIFQAVTSIQEMTLTFIPKIAAVLFALVIFGSWMLQQVLMFSSNLLLNLPNYVR